MIRPTARLAAAAAALALAAAAPAPPAAIPAVEGYADLADLALASPVVLRATVAKAERLGRKEAPDVAAGRARFLMTATVDSVLLAPAPVPARIEYLWDAATDARGRPPKPNGAAVLLFLRPAPGREGQYQLAAGRAQLAATPAAEARLRRIVAEARTPAASALRIAGIANVFHVPGSIPGESESQIFVRTADGKTVSLVVLSRPGQAKSIAYATGDIIDDAASSIPRDTMLWYRLACGLPRTLPDSALADLDAAGRRAARADYAAVLASLGPCGRTAA